ncbi:MAG: hypothetical protein Q7S12_00555 [bacterium]|nr:hypothetical protein [bacterium]
MRLDDRKEHILDFIVRDYIDTAVPVSSGRIVSRKVLDASSATLRNIMLELDEDGFLYQSHTSAGRAPTEKGYRYFIDNLMEIGDPAHDVRNELDSMMNDFFEESEHVFEDLSRMLAKHLRLFSGISVLDDERIFGHGLPEVLREPEFFEHGAAVRFVDFAENIQKNLKRHSDIDADAKGFGMVSVMFDGGDLGKCVVFSAGPQRMNYEKATSLLKYAAEDIKNRKIKKHAK